MTLIKVNNRGQKDNLGRRNLVINGDMKIAQRGAGPTQATNSAYFGPDRYRFFVNGGGAYTVTQDSGHQADTGHDKALKIAVTTADTSIAAGDYYTFLQRIESNSLQHLQYGTSSAKSLTLSFWVRATKTGTQAVFFSKQGTGTDYNHIKEYTINASNTWEHKTITIPGLTASTMTNDASTYLQVGFMLKYGSDFQGTKDTWTTNSHFTTANAVNNMDSTSNTFYVTGVQLEVGDIGTDFEHRSFGEELLACQRYAFKGDVQCLGSADSAGNIQLAIQTPVNLRTNPTLISFSSSLRGAVLAAASGAAFSAMQAPRVTITVSNTGSANTLVAGFGGSASIHLDSEL